MLKTNSGTSVSDVVALTSQAIGSISVPTFEAEVVTNTGSGHYRWLGVTDGSSLLKVRVPVEKIKWAKIVGTGQQISIRSTIKLQDDSTDWYLDAGTDADGQKKGWVEVVADEGPIARQRRLAEEALIASGHLTRERVNGFKVSVAKDVVLPEVRKVIVLTSAQSKGWRDFKRTASDLPRRVEPLAPRYVKTQGDGAAEEIASELRKIRQGDADLVFIVRGGGGWDALRTYDDPDLAAAITRCPVPVVTAVGHDGDVHLADLVAHAAIMTPSEAGRALSYAAWKPIKDDSRAKQQAKLERDKVVQTSQRAAADAALRDLPMVRAQMAQLWRYTDATLLKAALERVKTRYRLAAAGCWLAALVVLTVTPNNHAAILIGIACTLALIVAGVVAWLAPRNAQRPAGKWLQRRLPTTGEEWVQRAEKATTVAELRRLHYRRP